MGSLVEIGLANALLAGMLALVAVVAGRVSRRPALVHALWLLVLIKLVTPPIVTLPLPWWKSPPIPVTQLRPPNPTLPIKGILVVTQPVPPMPATVQANGPPPMRIQDLIPDASGKLPVMPVAPKMPPTSPRVEEKPLATAPRIVQPVVAAAAAVDDPPPPPSFDWSGVAEFAGVVWIVGAVLWFLVAAYRIRRFQRLLRHARSAPEELQELAKSLAKQLGLSRGPPIALVPGPIPPLLWAVGSPARLFFPQTLLPRLDEASRSTLLMHELAHLARRDHWVRWLELFACGLYWWYPLAWLACRRLQAAEEECCDAWVISELPGFGAVYAGALLETVDFLSHLPAPLPPSASGFGRVHHLKRRLTMIVRGATPRGLSVAGKLLILALLIALPLTPGRARPVAPPQEEAAPETLKTPRIEGADPRPMVPKAIESSEVPPDEPENYSTTPRVLQGNGGAFWANSISPDGKTLAAVSGGLNGNANGEGALTLFDLPSGKERICLTQAKPIRSVCFSADGKILATGDFDSKIQLRDPNTGAVLRVLEGHTGVINALAFSRDGKNLFSASLDKTLRQWDVPSGKSIKTFTGPTDWILSVAVTADGKRLISGCRDKTATIWDVATGKPLHTLKGHTNWVENVVFSPDDTLVVTTSQDALLKVWDARTGKYLRDLTGHSGPINTAVFLPDGKTLASCSHDQTIALWDVASGTMTFSIATGHAERIYGLSVSRDGKTLASAAWDQNIKLWDVATRKVRQTLRPRRYKEEQSFPILTLACSPDGKWIAVGGEEKAIKVIDPVTGQLKWLLEGHDDMVSRVAFSPDGKLLASASFDGTVALWDLATGKRLRSLTGHDSWVFTLAFSPDGALIASGGYDRTIRLWQTRTGNHLATLKRHRGGVRALAFSRDGKSLASGGADKVIRIWDVLKKEIIQSLPGHDDGVRTLCFSADGKRLVSGSEDTTTRLWDIAQGKQLASHKHSDVVRDLTFSPRGQRLVAVDQGRILIVFDPATLKPISQRNTASGDAATAVAFGPGATTLYVSSLDRMVRAWQGTAAPRQPVVTHGGSGKQMWFASYSPDGKRLAIGGGDGALDVRDIRMGKLLGGLDRIDDAAFHAAVSPDGTQIAVACGDKVVRIYDLATRKLRKTLAGHGFRVWTVAFSPDGQSLATASGSWENAEEVGEVKVWDLKSGKEKLSVAGLTASTQAVAWSANGKFLATGSRDGTVRLFEANSGKPLHALKGARGGVRSVVFSPDSRYLATGDDEAVRIWSVADAKELAQLTIPSKGINGLDWSRDGQMIAATGRAGNAMQPGTIRLWQVSAVEGAVPTFKEKATLKGHADTVLSCAFSPDSKRLLTGGGQYNNRGEVALWDMATGRLLVRMHGAKHWSEGVTFSRDGKLAIAAAGSIGRPGEVLLWSLEGEGAWQIADLHKGEVSFAVWSPDGKRIATGGYDGLVKLSNAATGKLEKTLVGHKGHVRCLAFSPDGKSLASAGVDKSVRLWDLLGDLMGDKDSLELAKYPLEALSVAFSIDGKWLASSSGYSTGDNPSGEVRLIEVATGKERKGAWNGKGARSLAFSPDGKHLTTGGAGTKALRLFDLKTGRLVREIDGANAVRVIAYSKDGKTLATAHEQGSRHGNGSVQVWDTTTWQEKAALMGHTGTVLGMSFSPDGKQVATASNDKTVKIWDLAGKPPARVVASVPVK